MDQTKRQITLVSFFRFNPGERLWGMKQMMVTQNRMKGTDGLVFHKMLGTGGGDGYSSRPDFGTYALLSVWESRERAESFESASKVMEDFRKHAFEIYSIFLSPIQSRGFWSGRQPFSPVTPDKHNPLIVILTRATLKPRYYIPFWKRVGRVSQSHFGSPGLFFSKGVGERPWIMQATFSVWRSVEDMTAFAHTKGGRHFEAIQTTRRLTGFREELYARFQPIQSIGTWFGKDPVGVALKDR